MKPRRVPRRLRWASITARWSALISGTTMGTSSVHRWAELLETMGHSSLAYRSSRARISSFFISTAQKQKSTMDASCSASFSASSTTRFLASSGMGTSRAQRPSTAWAYGLPALRALAAIAVSWNQGWFSIRVMNRWPTMPVPPMMPTLYCFIVCASCSHVAPERENRLPSILVEYGAGMYYNVPY